MNHYLTKSDLKVARSCATKFYYKKLGYPTTSQMTHYMKTLSEGSFMLGKMARLLYPEGIEIGVHDSLDKAIAQTKTELAKDQVTLFEPVIYSDRKLVRVDILVKNGKQIQIIEVKSKSFDSEENQKLQDERGINICRSKKDGRVNSLWRPYISDLAYQTWILQEMLGEGEYQIFPSLLLPDRHKTTNIDLLPSFFQIQEISGQAIASKFSHIKVDYTGDLAALQASNILTLVPLQTEVAEVMPDVIAEAKILLDSMGDRLQKIEVEINKNCKNCEFRGNPDDPRDGFRECWQELADLDPHILELYQVGRVGGNATPLVNELIRQKKVSLYDMPLEALDDQAFLHRQLIQIEYTQKNQEWFSPHLKNVLGKLAYPLHFIDFESSRLAIPYHAGMRSYEQVAFQWSCHTIASPGAIPIHSEWIDLENSFPNFDFAEALRSQIGLGGTVLTWATHENSVLRDIFYQMEAYGGENDALKSWLLKIVKFGDRSKSTFVDMNALTLKHYFHPLMNLRTSLKYVLPAIWKTNSYLHQIPYFANYLQVKNDEILSPYQTLPPLEIGDRQIVIREGTEAMLAYQDLLYGKHKNDPEIKAKWRELLRQYCCLDTMAMVIIWTHWQHLLRSQ